jgi:hypothetical protein
MCLDWVNPIVEGKYVGNHPLNRLSKRKDISTSTNISQIIRNKFIYRTDIRCV